MPLKAERALKKSARKHGFKKGSKRWGRYIYGTMYKHGWRKKR